MAVAPRTPRVPTVNAAKLQLVGVSAAYPTDRRVVLHDVALAVDAGEVVALVGPNGSGKSTILRVASGVLRPRDGKVLLDGRDIVAEPSAAVARRLAVVAQDATFPSSMTARELVELGRTPHLRLLFGPRQRDRAAVDWALEVTASGYLANRFVDELSGGERQRVLLARALAQQPRVLLLDEPTANLDLRHQVAALELVRQLARADGLAVLAALHDLQLAALYCDRIFLLRDGRVAMDGPPEVVLTQAHLRPAFEQDVALVAHPTHGVPLVAIVPNGQARKIAPVTEANER
jgi:iron complex transport system ATP-binding protein